MATTEEILDPLFKELADGICVTNGRGDILYMNPAAQALLDLPFPESAGKSLCSLLCEHLFVPGSTEAASSLCPLLSSRSEQKTFSFCGRYGPQMAYEWKESKIYRMEQWKNLRIRCLKMSTSLFDSWEADKHFMLIEDASAELELQRHKEDWRQMIAHDLRAPLTNILGALRLLAGAPPGHALEPAETKLLKSSLKACQVMIELLNLYHEVARFDAGLMPVSLARVDLLELAGQAVEEQSALARERRVEIAVEMPKGLEALADPELLLRVFQNILNNAIKFSPEGGRVEMAGRGTEGRVRVSFRDAGPGVASEDLPYLFDRYYQAKARRAGKIQGTGLGLTFCFEALKAMKGEIAVESQPGAGASFILGLPAPPGPAEGKGPEPSKGQETS